MCILFIGLMAIAAFRKAHNIVAILTEDKSCVTVLGNLSWIASWY